jgi:hypothetical protein
MTNGYSPTIDQPAFAAIFDLTQARACGSFEKLERVISRFFDVAASHSS